MLKKYNPTHKCYSKMLHILEQTNTIAVFFIILAFFGGYYLIETTLIETHHSSGLGAAQHYHVLKKLKYTKDKFRFVSIGYMSAIPLFYGLDTFDGFLHNSPYRRNYFIAYAIYDPPIDKLHTHTQLFFSLDGLDFNMLKMANVGYIFSENLFVKDGFTLVDQSKPVYINDIAYPLKAYISSKFDDLRLVNSGYIYSLEQVWPRIFSAKSIKHSLYSFRDKRFYKELKKLSFAELLVAKEDINQTIVNSTVISPIFIKNYILNEKGAEIDIISKGGILVFNQVVTPFWSASCEGKKLTVFPVNGIMMAVYVPSGCQKVFFEYRK